MEFLLRIEGSEDGWEEPQNVEHLDNVLFDIESGEWKVLFYDLRDMLSFMRRHGQVTLIPSDEFSDYDTIVIPPVHR